MSFRFLTLKMCSKAAMTVKRPRIADTPMKMVTTGEFRSVQISEE